MISPPFGEVWKDRLEKITKEAESMGLNWTDLCREAGMSRATPQRWKNSNPQTVELIEKVERVLDDHRARVVDDGNGDAINKIEG